MPRTKSLDYVKELKAPKEIQIDYLGDFYTRYKKGNSISIETIAEALGISVSGAKAKLARGIENFTCAEYKKMMVAVKAPPKAAAAAISNYLNQE